ELATVSRQVPIDFDLEAFRLREPDWPRLRALWMEMEFSRLLKDLPAQTVEVGTEPVAALATEAALRDYLAGVPPGEPVAMDWAGKSRPPEPELQGLGLFHPAAGGAFVPLGPETAEAIGRTLGGSRELIVHDAKPVLGWLLARGVAPPAVEDSAVAAYLLNPARQSYPLEQLSLETLGESPPDLAGAAGLGPAELGARLAARARAVWRYWGYAAGQLDALGLRSVYAEIERPLVPVLARMERAGIRVDVERLEGFAKELERSLDAVTREVYTLAGEPFNIGSPKQLAHILFEKLGLPVARRTKTGYSTDADVLTELALGHELPAKILEYRLLSKLKSTYADALPGLINPATGRIHTTFNQLVAATGRLSASDPNVQNIPIRTELGRRIRAAFVPDPGYRFVAADYSQIELRILAHVSGEESLIAAFHAGEDIHRRTAAEVYGVELAQVTQEQRDVAKTTNFAVIYGV